MPDPNFLKFFSGYRLPVIIADAQSYLKQKGRFREEQPFSGIVEG